MTPNMYAEARFAERRERLAMSRKQIARKAGIRMRAVTALEELGSHEPSPAADRLLATLSELEAK